MRLKGNHRGFTFIELILVMTLIGIMFAVTSVILLRGLDSYQFVTERATLLERTRFAVDRMVREFQFLEEGDITVIFPTSIQFVDDLGGNASFNLIDGTLYRGNDILCPNVTAFTLSYFDGNGGVVANPDQVRRIGIDLTAQGGGTSGAIQLRTEIAPRGMIYEGYN